VVTATVKTEGNGQTISLPEGFLVEGSEVILKRIGRTVLLIPKDANPWEVFEKSLELVTDDFMRERNQPMEQTREANLK
jgi:antitoxin VapB